MARKKRQEGEPILIKKYANRRLYNTDSSSYITLDNLADLIRAGEDVVVEDAKSGDDLTRAVLTQIILERETSDQQSMLSLPFLQNLIRFYGDKVESVVPSYLQSALDSFSKHQDKLRDAMSGGGTNFSKVVPSIFEEITRQNMAMFQKSLGVLTGGALGSSSRRDSRSGVVEAQKSEIDQLKQQLEALQSKVEKLSD